MTERVSRPTRRRLLTSGSGLAAGLLVAGCTDGGLPGGSAGSGDDPTATPDGGADGSVYVPPHFHERRVAGTGTAAGYAVGLAFSVPDYYWTVDGASATRVTLDGDEDVHLLGSVWDPESGTVLPDVDLRATVTRDGTTAAETTLAPTLTQRWGLCHGGNLALGTYTEYEVELRVGAGDARRTRGFADAFESEASATVTLEFDRGTMDGIGTTYLDAAGERGAVRPLTDDALPPGRRTDPADLPGTVVGQGQSGDASLAALALGPDESPLDDGSPYLALLAATPYNDYRLPGMAVTGTLRRGGEAVYDGALEPTLDPSLGYHYGAALGSVDAGSAADADGWGDALELSFPTPPQVARREGYETAFRSMPDTELTLDR